MKYTRMISEEIIQKLREIAKHYEEDWTLYDLQCDLEELFNEVLKDVSDDK